MIEVKVEIFEAEERDWDIILQDLIGMNAKNVRRKSYDEKQEKFLLHCEFDSEREAERFVVEASENFLCNTKILG